MKGNNPRLKLGKAQYKTDLTYTDHSMGDMQMWFFKVQKFKIGRCYGFLREIKAEMRTEFRKLKLEIY